MVKQKAKQKKEKKEIELNAVLQPPLTTYTAKKHFCKNPTPVSTGVETMKTVKDNFTSSVGKLNFK